MAHKRSTQKSDAKDESRKNLIGVVIVIVSICAVPVWMIYKSFTALPSGTRETFSEQYSCPDDRITSKDRPDMHGADFETKATPPADIAKDPGRLAVWQKNQSQPWDVDFFELTGCGHHVLWGCRLPSSKSSNGVHAFCPYTRDLP